MVNSASFEQKQTIFLDTQTLFWSKMSTGKSTQILRVGKLVLNQIGGDDN